MSLAQARVGHVQPREQAADLVSHGRAQIVLDIRDHHRRALGGETPSRRRADCRRRRR